MEFRSSSGLHLLTGQITFTSSLIHLDPSVANRSTILFVEDDALIRETTVDLLMLSGAQVHAVHSGHAAARFLEAHLAAIIITDMAMPEGDGSWLLRHVRSVPRLRHIPVIILSAHADMRMIADGLASGADAYLTKPYDPIQLLSTVKHHLETMPDRPTATATE